MQDNKQLNQSTPGGSLRPDIVKDIPVAAQNSKPRAVNEDDELDTIMRDVGRDLKQVGKKPPKQHWFSKQNKAKAEPKFSARPVEQIKTPPAALAPKPVAAAPKPVQTNPPAAAKLAAPVKAKPSKTSQPPVGVVVLAVIVTVGLIAAAFYAYK